MRDQRLVLLLVAAGLALPYPRPALAQPAAAAMPASGSLFLHPERLALPGGEWAEAERGVLYVPLKRQPPGGLVAVEFHRFAAGAGADAATPPIFILPGGPGWEGLPVSREDASFYESKILPLTRVTEVVVVGQRGIGSSQPNTVCAPPPAMPPGAAVRHGDRSAALRLASRRCKAFWQRRGLDLSGLTVAEAAADVRDLSAALGYERIILWGGSFGSHWAMAVMRYHPRIVARAVLTGLEGPDHTWDMPSSVLRTLERMAAAAAASPEIAALLPEGGLIAAFRQAVARVDAQPAVVRVTDPGTGEPAQVHIGPVEIREMIVGYSGSARRRSGLPRWPAELLELSSGDFAAAARARHTAAAGSFPTASYFMLDCGSGISRARKKRLMADPAVAVVGFLGWFYQAACEVWGSDVGDELRAMFETEIPTVLVQGDWDLSTPLDNALELAPYFKRGKLVVVKGGTHRALFEAQQASAAFRRALMGFIARGDASAMPEEVVLPPIAWEVPGPGTGGGPKTPG